MNAIQTSVVTVVHLLVVGEYDVIESMTHGVRLSAQELRGAVESYGRTLIELPESELDGLDVVTVEGASVPTLSVVVDLWTEEEGKSDLSLELMLIDRYGGAYEVQVSDLHVL